MRIRVLASAAALAMASAWLLGEWTWTSRQELRPRTISCSPDALLGGLQALGATFRSG